MAALDRGIWRRVLGAAGLVAMVAIVVVSGVLVVTPLLALFGSLLLAILLRGIGNWLARHLRFLSPTVAYWITFVGFLTLITVAAIFLAPRIVDQLDEVGAQVSGLLEEAQERAREVGWLAPIADSLPEALDGEELGQRAMQAVSLSIEGLAYLLVTLTVAMYLGAAPKLYLGRALLLIPPEYRARMQEALEATEATLRRFLIGRVVSMVGVGVMTGISMWLIGVPLPMLLALIAGAFTFVPYAGPWAAGVPIALLAATEGVTTLAVALLTYTVIQMIEGFAITPLVQERMVALPPAVTLAAELLLAVLFGVIGIVMAVPLAAGLGTLLRYLWVEDVLGSAENRQEGDLTC